MQEHDFQAVGLDAGSVHTRCVILDLERGRLRFKGCGEARSGGWQKSRIADQKAVTASILEAVRDAEAMAQCPVESAGVGIGGNAGAGAESRPGVGKRGPPG